MLRVTVNTKAKRPKGVKTKYSSIPAEVRASANMNIEYTKEEIEEARNLRESANKEENGGRSD